MAFSLTLETRQLDKPIMQNIDSTGEATAQHPRGYTVNSDDGRTFVYVQALTADVEPLAGAPAVWALSTDQYVVTPDVSDTASVACGAFMSILKNEYFGWIQTKGKVVDAPTSGAQAVMTTGDGLYGTDQVWKTGAVGTNHIKAVALEAGDTYAVIQLLDS